jgi:hypothetical protein
LSDKKAGSMTETGNGLETTSQPTEKRQGILISALKFGSVIALINTFIDGLRIWQEAPTQAYLQSLGAGASAGTPLAYHLSALINAAFTNLLVWFVVALTMLFVLRQLKRT